MYEFITNGTCSTRINFCIEDGKLHSVKFENGCDGNLKALGALVEGMDASEVVKRLKGIRCGDRGTSCADQLARAIERNHPALQRL
jgi:uncharacterized protein (TIGR03905 family)